MRPSTEEQETVINFGRNDSKATVYTSDARIMTKLDRFVSESEVWELEGQETCEGDIVAKKYSCPVNFISFRSKKRVVQGRPLSQEQIAKMQAARSRK